MKDISIPRPFCFDAKNIKAFVLGADPTNFSNKGNRVVLSTVFGIGDGDPRYFLDILSNLKAINLSLETIYVQNLVGEYLKEETSKSKDWENYATKWLPSRVKEFNLLDGTKKIPVLITAERILHFLLDDLMYPKAKDYYNLDLKVPIINNKLQRPIIPFYRHYKYSLSDERWKGYKERLIELF